MKPYSYIWYSIKTESIRIAVARNEYDENGKLTAMPDSIGNETELSYASNGTLTGITDQIGVVHALTYDE